MTDPSAHRPALEREQRAYSEIAREMKPTPGPWAVNFTRLNSIVARWHITGSRHGSVYPICEHQIEQEPDASEQLANARLIASAPDMAEEIARLKAVNAELVAVLQESERCLSFVLAGEDARPAKWLIPGSALRDAAIVAARAALAKVSK